MLPLQTFPWASCNQNLQNEPAESPLLPAFAVGPYLWRGYWILRHAVCWNLNLCHVLFALFFVLCLPGTETQRGGIAEAHFSIFLWKKFHLEMKAHNSKGFHPHVKFREFLSLSLDPIFFFHNAISWLLVFSTQLPPGSTSSFPGAVPLYRQMGVVGPVPSIYPLIHLEGLLSSETSTLPKQTPDIVIWKRRRTKAGNLLFCSLTGCSVSSSDGFSVKCD